MRLSPTSPPTEELREQMSAIVEGYKSRTPKQAHTTLSNPLNMSTTSHINSSAQPLAGKVAIVTGSSRGIGAATAKRLAADGAIVAVNYVHVTKPLHHPVEILTDAGLHNLQGADAAKTVVEEIKKAGGEAHAFQADVGVRDQVFALVEAVVQRWGRLDILVNNSAVGELKPLEEVTEDQLDQLLAVNFKGPLWGIQAAAKHLKSGGSIINVSTGAVRIAPAVCSAFVTPRLPLCNLPHSFVSVCTSRALDPTEPARPPWNTSAL
jgi:NAD(P)-dependent dehydrogenase (short-subunit alcohol dehydrogenase family)